MTTLIQFKRLHPAATLPTRATRDSAGFDLYSVEDAVVCSKPVAVNTGIAVRIPPGYYGRIAPRSGLALHENIWINGGVIDRDYTGPLKIIMVRPDNMSAGFPAGSRVAQLIIEKCIVDYCEVTEFAEEQFDNHVGFGSTGL
jgi:dUTP pyrophosphatase